MKVLLGQLGNQAVSVVWQKHFDEVLIGGQEMVEEVDRGGEIMDSEGCGVLSEVIAREEVVCMGSTETKRDGSSRERWPNCGNDKQRSAGGPLVGAVQLVLDLWNGSISWKSSVTRYTSTHCWTSL